MGTSAFYFLGSQLLGTSQSIPRWDDWQVHHKNVAHFCPQCGEVWARIMDSRLAGWHAQTTLCSKHGGGSFISPWRSTFEELPPEVLNYELHLLITRHETANRSPATAA